MYQLVEQLKALNISNIRVIGALHIEDESRKLPKTGYYEGTPFYGSAEKRAALVTWWNMYLREMCKDNGWEYVGWMNEMLNEDGRLDFKFMEKPKSVHLSREWYHYDFETNQFNNRYIELKKMK